MRINSPKSIFFFFYKGLSKSLALGIILSTIFTNQLYGGYSATGVISGGTVVNGYFNNTGNQITVTVVINDDGTNTMDTFGGGTCRLLIRFAEDGDEPEPVNSSATTSQNDNDWITMSENQNMASNHFLNQGLTSGAVNFSNNTTATLRFSPSDLTVSTINQAPQGDGFKLWVWLNDGGSNHLEFGPVTFDGGSTDFLVYDTEDPGVTNTSGTYSIDEAGNNDDYFSSNVMNFQPDENLNTNTSDSDLRSYIKLLGTSAGNGTDENNPHVYYIGTNSSAERTASSDTEIDLGFTLRNGAGYTMQLFLVDLAGNSYSHTTYRENKIFDNAPPTVDNVSNFQISSGGTWETLQNNEEIGDGSVFRHRLSFSEKVTASGTSVITYNTGGTSSIPASDFSGMSNTSPYYITITHTIDKSAGHIEQNSIDISTINNVGGWRDAAGNDIASSGGNYPRQGNNISDVANVKADLTKPYIASVTATPTSGNFGIHSATHANEIPITIIFNEVVDLDAAAEITVYLDSKGATGLTPIGRADITTVSGVSQATVNYQVAEGDASARLSVNSIAITSADFTKLKDALDYNANSAVSLARQGGTDLVDNTNLVIETTRPIIGKIFSAYANDTYGEGALIPVSVNFFNGSVAGGSEDVTLSGGSITLTMNTGASVTISTVDDADIGSGTYTVVTGDTETNSLVASTMALGTAVIVDDFKNILSSSTIPADNFSSGTNNAIVIDVTKPSIQTISARRNTTPITTNTTITAKMGDAIEFTFNFNEPTKLSGDGEITLNSGGKATFTAYSNSDAPTATYTVASGDETPDNVFLDITDYDLKGNNLTDNPARDFGSIYKPNEINSPISPGTAFTTDYDIIVDGVLPTVTSVTTTVWTAVDNTALTASDGPYGIGESITVQVTFNELVKLSGNVLPLDLGLTGAGTLNFATFTVGATTIQQSFTVTAGDPNGTGNLDVVGDALPAPAGAWTLEDLAGNEMANRAVTSNISANTPIVIDGSKPGKPQSVSLAPFGGSADLSNASDYTLYFNSTNSHLDVTVEFDVSDATMEEGSIYLEAILAGGTPEVLIPDVSESVRNQDNTQRRVYRISGSDWTNEESVIRVDSSKIKALTGYGEVSLEIRATLIDKADNLSATSDTSNAVTIDHTIPSLTSISYAEPGTTPERPKPYPKDSVIPIKLTFGSGGNAAADKVTLLNSGQINITLNVGTPSRTVSFVQSGSIFGQTTNASSTGTSNYTVNLDEYNTAALTVSTISVSAATVLRDLAGNAITSADLAANLAAGSFTNLSGLFVDGDLPDAPTIGTITTSTPTYLDVTNGETNFWNQDNSTMVFAITLATDASMENGVVSVLARTGSNAFAALATTHDPVLDTEAASTPLSITITSGNLDQIIGWPTLTTTVGDVDFKIRSQDYAGNITDTEDASRVTVYVDEIDPGSGSISNLITNVPANSSISEAIQGYWNIDTDYLKVVFGDISGKDVNIEGGKVQLFGQISTFGWDTLGTVGSISSGNKTNFNIEVGALGDYGGTQTDGAAPYGIKELPKDGDTWPDMDGNSIGIKALVTDAAGNSTEYLYTNTNNFLTGNSTLLIDGIIPSDRPYIRSATADKASGWWGPNSAGLPIQIQITATDPITVDIVDGTPSIKLETGAVDGTALYSSSSGLTSVFNYTPDVDSYTSDLDFFINNNEAVIDLNGGKMYEASGNYLLFGTNNATSPKLPYPGAADTSLSFNKNLIIDGIAPYYVSTSGQYAMRINNIYPRGDEARTGYYNSGTTEIEFDFNFRSTNNDLSLDDNGDRVDMSLASNNPNEDCNTVAGGGGLDCGTIQIKAEAVPDGDTPGNYLDLGDKVDISYTDLTSGENYAEQEIEFTAAVFENNNAVKYDNLFSDGNSITFKALITDLAGNQTETAVYGTPIIVDQTPPGPALRTGSVITTAPQISNQDPNIVSGYWNSHNTGIQVTVPIPDDDTTLLAGEIRILGKKTGAASYNELGLYNEEAYNITSAEINGTTSILPSSDTFLEDTVDGNWGGYRGVEEISEYGEGESLTFAARVFDVAGNYTDWLESSTTLTVDETVPTVVEVTSLNEERAYKAGDTINISVIASENITAPIGVDNTNSTLELLNTNGANPALPFRNASSDTVYYTYIIGNDESSEDTDPLITTADRLNYAVAATSLDVKATGALIDPAGNNLATGLPTVAGDSALANNKNIIIDNDAPGVTFTYFETATTAADSSDSLISVNDIKLIIHATFTDSIQIDSIPTLEIDFPVGPGDDNSIGDKSSQVMTRIGSWKYEYELNLIDSVNGKLEIRQTAYDKAANLIDQAAAVDSVIRMDNVHPVFTSYSPDDSSYVNSGKVKYDLSETVDSASITWERIGGNSDNADHEQILVGNELKSGLLYNYEVLHDLTDPPVNLVDGTVYKVIWFAEDSAGNRSVEDIHVSTPVTYDTTKPNVYLDYKLDVVSSGSTDTIWATFSEPVRLLNNSLQHIPPKIKIDFLDEGNVAPPGNWETMTIDSSTVIDSTKWFYVAPIPSIGGTSCSTNVEIDAKDLAGNSILSINTWHVTGFNNKDTLNSVTDYDLLIVDNSVPTCVLSYVNISQSWLTNESNDFTRTIAHGKSGDIIQITASLSEEFGKLPDLPDPRLNINFSYPGEFLPALDSSIVNSSSILLLDSLGQIDSVAQITNNDSTAIWYLRLPDTTHGIMSVTLKATDRANDTIPTVNYQGPKFRIDNIFPDSLTTESATAYAAPGLPQPNEGWINFLTDSIVVNVNIPSDTSLFTNPEGGLHIELLNKNRGGGVEWVNIPKDTSGGLPSADVLLSGGSSAFYRTIEEVYAKLPQENEIAGLVQGDSIYIRVALSDRAGNKTPGYTSVSIFEYDPYPPTVSNVDSGNVYDLDGVPDTLRSVDKLSAGWTNSSDSTWVGSQEKPGSGIKEYEYKIITHDANKDSLKLLIDWTSNGRLEFVERTDKALHHKHHYSFNIRAVDTAGNVSETVYSDTIYREGSSPVITNDPIIEAYEDILYLDTILVTDLDLATLEGDSFKYYSSWKDTIIPTNGTGVDTFINNMGIITWKPTPQDTGNFRLQIAVVDKDSLSDTLDYPLKIWPVNDPPYFRFGDAWDLKYDSLTDLQMPPISFEEDDSFKVYLTQYIHDEDNNDTNIIWKAFWYDDTTDYPGYPEDILFSGAGIPQSDYQFQGELKTFGTRMNAKSLAEKIQIVITKNDTGSFASIKTDADYYGPHSVLFVASDSTLNLNYAGLNTVKQDSVIIDLTINAINDAPRWDDIPDQTMMENDTFRIDLGKFVHDVDDTTLKFKLDTISTSGDKIFYHYTLSGEIKEDSSRLGIMYIDSSEYESQGYGDSIARFIPEKLWSGSARIRAIAEEITREKASDTAFFNIDIIRVQRPGIKINVVQNNVFSAYYDVIVTDTNSKADNVILKIDSERLALDTIGPFNYHGHHKFDQAREHTFLVEAYAPVGDTLVKRQVGLAFAKTLGRWSGSSPDGIFNVNAEAGAVNMDQSILLIDSTMFEKGYSGSYKLGDEVRVFNKPVEVSLSSYDDELALYQRNTDNTWTELPSYIHQGRIRAYTDRMGYFQLGRKTLIVPGLTSLGQNYPNPFNPVTNITYDVGFVDGPQQQVNLSIYNLLGQHVQTLVNDQRGVGRYMIKWNGRHKSGVSVASGIYFVHMVTSAGKVQTKKVMLLR